MQANIEDVESAALQLPPTDRPRLAERLIASLDEDVEIERLWAEEIRRRVQQIGSSEVETIPAEQVFDELKKMVQ